MNIKHNKIQELTIDEINQVTGGWSFQENFVITMGGLAGGIIGGPFGAAAGVLFAGWVYENIGNWQYP